jgi:glucosylceramidase
MNKLRASSVSIGFAFVVAACSGNEPGNDPAAGGSGGSGNTGGTTGGSAGSGTGGTTGGSAPTGGAGGTGGTGGVGGAGPAGASGTGGVGGAGPAGSGGGPSGAGGTPPGAGTGGTPPLGGMGGDAGGAGGSPGGAAGAPIGGAPPVVEEPTLVTSANGAFWKVGAVTEVTDGTAEITVTESMGQTWSGFGGTFNEKGWEALSALSEADRAAAIKLLFDKNDGANFVYGRIPIGASDYASNRYTLNETAGDTTMTNFSIARDKEKLIPYIKAAQGVRSDIKFWGSPWTPPTWMKDNNAFDKGNMKNDAATLEAFALYLSKFVEEYGKEGIPIMAIHPQNEPGYVQDYPSCAWTGSQFANFIKTHLGPMFEERAITAQIFVGTMSNSSVDTGILNAVVADSAAHAFVKGYGLQWGLLDSYAQANMNKSLQIWQTEHKCGNYPWESGTDQSRAPNDFAYGVESWGLLRDWIKKGVNAYSAWNMVLDTVGRSLDTVRPWAQNALLAVDVGAKKLNITPTYYVFRHLSQYVDPGAKLVTAMGGDTLAFKNPDGSTVAVMYNSGGAKTSIISIGGKKLSFPMPANGWATVNWK